MKGEAKKEICDKAICKPSVVAPQRKAHLVTIGVNQSKLVTPNLHYASNDANKMKDKLEPVLTKAGFKVDHPVVLISDDASHNATKLKIEQAIKDIAARSTPDDLVMVSFSGHGFGGKGGTFYLIPEEDPKQPIKSEDLDKNTQQLISADDLTRWFRPMNAAEIVLIVDACYSAGAVPEGFKPAPLGDRGLGQLAYDKRMRILVASQRDQTARERKGIDQGVLTYVLLNEGLDPKIAGENGKLTLARWLAYPVDGVPRYVQKLDADAEAPQQAVDTKKASGTDFGLTNTTTRKNLPQTPTLFDFKRKQGKEVVLNQLR